MSGFQNDVTYGQIKEHVLEQTGLKVPSLLYRPDQTEIWNY